MYLLQRKYSYVLEYLDIPTNVPHEPAKYKIENWMDRISDFIVFIEMDQICFVPLP